MRLKWGPYLVLVGLVGCQGVPLHQRTGGGLSGPCAEANGGATCQSGPRVESCGNESIVVNVPRQKVIVEGPAPAARGTGTASALSAQGQGSAQATGLVPGAGMAQAMGLVQSPGLAQ